MPVRFRKRVQIIPGLYLNVGKTGLSVSIGKPGLCLNLDLSGRRKKPARYSLGLPGTGLGYSDAIDVDASNASEEELAD